MCEYVVITDNVLKEMEEIYPKNISKDYFLQFEALVREHIKKNKEKHFIKKTRIKGKEGMHELIYGRIEDAEAVLPTFEYCFRF